MVGEWGRKVRERERRVRREREKGKGERVLNGRITRQRMKIKKIIGK